MSFASIMIRPIKLEDVKALVSLCFDSGLFAPDQLLLLEGMIITALEDTREDRPFWITDEDNGLVSLAYCEPERMTRGTWNLQLIAVRNTHQRQGRGARLLKYLGDILVARGARILLVETQGTPDFEQVRAFYRKHGFEEEARIREFYSEGIDKVIFRRRLTRSGE